MDSVGLLARVVAAAALFTALSGGYGAGISHTPALPTIAINPRAIAELENNMDAWVATNLMPLRNTRRGNFLDYMAFTLPCGRDNTGILVGPDAHDAGRLGIVPAAYGKRFGANSAGLNQLIGAVNSRFSRVAGV